MFTLGNSGGICSSLVYIAKDAPHYQRGHGVGLGFAFMAVVLSLLLSWDLKRENARRDAAYGSAPSSMQRHVVGDEEYERQLVRWGLQGKTQDEIDALGDKHPGFRYIA